MWSKPKINPNDATIEISDVVERVEVVTEPSFSVRTQDGSPIVEGMMLDGDWRRFRSREEVVSGDYFTPRAARLSFTASIRCSNAYIAEGRISFPHLMPQPFSFTFGIPEYYNHSYKSDRFWRLRLQTVSSPIQSYCSLSPLEVIGEALSNNSQTDHWKKNNAALICKNIESYFLGVEGIRGSDIGYERIHSLRVRAEKDASAQYELDFESQLNQRLQDNQAGRKLLTQNPLSFALMIQPCLYIYDVRGKDVKLRVPYSRDAAFSSQ
ncbi:hypothetical protein HY501_01530 [Candidatus Woesearchaeota archaeon]|nr:hypothetical protein [Candidatus Woesearchaeota archaeon]